MSASSSTRFYVEKPCDEYWNTATNWVVEAGPINVSEPGLWDWQKTDQFVRDNLRVIAPKDFKWPHIQKSQWVECSGPARQLQSSEYVQLYHSIKPDLPFPKGWNGPK